MKTNQKTRKIIKLSMLIGGSLLLSSALTAALSSCVITIERPGNNGDKVKKSLTEIDWNKKNIEDSLVIDKDTGIVYKDASREEIIALSPKRFAKYKKSSLEIPKSVKRISGYKEVLRDSSSPTGKKAVPKGAFEGTIKLTKITTKTTARLEKIDKDAFKDCAKLSSFELPSTTKIIGQSAFDGCTSLTSINLDSVTSIGDSAFKNCFSSQNNSNWTLDTNKQSTTTDITLTLSKIEDVGANAFSGCTKLASVSFSGNTLKIAGTGVFSGCTSLNNVDLTTTNLTVLSDSLFNGCSSLVNFQFPTNTSIIGQSTFSNTGLTTVTIPASTKTIKDRAFADSSSLANLSFQPGSKLNSLGMGFINGTAITNLNLSNAGLKTISSGMVSGNGKLQSVKLPIGLTTIDDEAFKDCTNLNNVNLNTSTNLETIGTHTFSGCTSLKSVTLGEGITTIRDNAFSNSGITTVNLGACTKLTTISSGMLSGNTKLTSITLPTNVERIADRAFQNCSGLTEIILPASVTSIGAQFLNGTGVANLNLSENISLTKIGPSAFEENKTLSKIDLPTGLVSIGPKSFKGTNISTIDIPETIEDLQSSAFEGNKNLSSLNFVSSLSRQENNNPLLIGDSAFFGCTELETISLPNRTQSIGSRTFERCSSLKTISLINSSPILYAAPDSQGIQNIKNNFPEKLIRIGDYAFKDSSLEGEIVLGSHVTSIGQGAFSDCHIEKFDAYKSNLLTSISDSTFENNYVLGEVNLPSKITSIGASAFNEAPSLTTIHSVGPTMPGHSSVYVLNTLPSTLTFIGPNAFKGTGLKNIDLEGTSVTNINDRTFQDSDELASVFLPSCLLSIGDSAFEGCSSLIFVGEINRSNQPISVSNLHSILIQNKQRQKRQQPQHHKSPPSSELPNLVQTVGAKAFYGAQILELKVGSKSNLTNVGADAFYGVNKLIYSKDSMLPKNFFSAFGSLTEAILEGQKITNISGQMPNSIITLNLSQTGIKSVNSREFFGNKNLLRINLPNTVTRIGESAFEGTTKLSSIYLANNDKNLQSIGNSAFKGSGIETFSLASNNEKITKIEDSTFENTNNLNSVKLSRNITHIGNYAFAITDGVKLIKNPSEDYDQIPTYYSSIPISLSGFDNVETIGNNAFKGRTIIQPFTSTNLISVGEGAFEDTLLNIIGKDVSLNAKNSTSKIIKIGNRAFKGTNLTNFNASSLITLGDSAFEGVSSLMEFNFYDSINPINMSSQVSENKGVLETIGDNALKGTGLTTFIAPATLKSIGEGALSEIDNLSFVDLSQTKLTTLPADLFRKRSQLSRFKRNVGLQIKKPLNVNLPSSLKSIDPTTFANSNVQSVNLSSSTFANPIFPTNAFENCDMLVNASLPKNITTITPDLFNNNKLKSITFPGTATRIELVEQMPKLSKISNSQGNDLNVIFDVFSKNPNPVGVSSDWFENVNWEQIANIMNMFASSDNRSHVFPGLGWDSNTNPGLSNDIYGSSLLEENTWISTSSSGSALPTTLNEKTQSATKIHNTLDWTYQIGTNLPNNQHATITATNAKYFKGYPLSGPYSSIGQVCEFTPSAQPGNPPAPSKNITITINIY